MSRASTQWIPSERKVNEAIATLKSKASSLKGTTREKMSGSGVSSSRPPTPKHVKVKKKKTDTKKKRNVSGRSPYTVI